MVAEQSFAERLRAPFPPSDVSWRIGQAGKNAKGFWAKVLAYVDNRAIMDRLDEVVGLENWRNEFAAGPGGGIICGLSLRIGGEWITKFDGAENTDIEAVKGGLSDAMKRAAVQFGIGRYLYNLGESWAVISENGAHYAKVKVDGKDEHFKWDHPRLPEWALPNGVKEPAKVAKQIEQLPPKANGEYPQQIATGTATKEQKDTYCADSQLIEACQNDEQLAAANLAVNADKKAGKLTKGLFEMLLSQGRQRKESLKSMDEMDKRFASAGDTK